MSLDSRLFRPRRSNSSSASSALVERRRHQRRQQTRSRAGSGRAMVVELGRCSRAGARRAALRARDDGGDDALDAARRSASGVVVAQLEPDRQAALAGGDAGRRRLAARRCRTASRARTSSPRPASIAAISASCVTLSRGDDGDVAPRRLLLRQRREGRQRRRMHAPRRRSRTRSALPAARTPGASADAARRRQPTRAPSSSIAALRPGCSAGCARGDEACGGAARAAPRRRP